MSLLTRTLTLIGSIAGFALGLGAGAAGYFQAFGPPSEFRDSMAFFEEHKDEFDVVFIGSSVMKFGIDPKVFDRAFADAMPNAMPNASGEASPNAPGNAPGVTESKDDGQGRSTIRSFNMSIPGAYGFEEDHRIRQIIAMKPERLRWMIIEPRLWKLTSEREYSDRDIWWHSSHETRFIADSIADIPVGWREKFPLLAGHVGHWAAGCLNIGKGSDGLGFLNITKEEERARRELRRTEDYSETGGYWRLTGDYIQFASPGMIQLADLAGPMVKAYERQLAQRVGDLNARGQVGATAPDHVRLAMRDQVKFLRAHGVEPIYVLPPGLNPYHSDFRWVHTLHWEGDVPEPFAFDDPRAYPDLYAPAARFDDAHLGEDGATLFSTYVAKMLAEKMASEAR